MLLFSACFKHSIQHQGGRPCSAYVHVSGLFLREYLVTQPYSSCVLLSPCPGTSMNQLVCSVCCGQRLFPLCRRTEAFPRAVGEKQRGEIPLARLSKSLVTECKGEQQREESTHELRHWNLILETLYISNTFIYFFFSTWFL